MLDIVEVVTKLINCPSVSPVDAGAQVYLKELLGGMGMECYDLPFEDVPNLFSITSSNEGPHFCFAGHTDVVPSGDEAAWKYHPYGAEVSAEGVLYGRGAVDMKGGVAAFICALSAFVDAHGEIPGRVSILITGDEEADAINGTVKVLEWVDENNYVPDFCLVGEPTNPSEHGEQIKTGRRGSLGCRFTVHGNQGHVAYPHLADNPLPRLARMLSDLSEYEWDKGNEWFPPSNLEITDIKVGNDAPNIIPESGQVAFNIRYNNLWDFESLEARVKEILDGVDKGYSIEFVRGSASFLSDAGEYADMMIAAVSDVTGKTPALTTEGGTSDARFVSRYCPVLEYGLVNATAHKVDEHTKVSDLKMLEKIYLRLLERFFGV